MEKRDEPSGLTTWNGEVERAAAALGSAQARATSKTVADLLAPMAPNATLHGRALWPRSYGHLSNQVAARRRT